MNRAVFLDRDNTLIVDWGYVYKITDLKWIEGAKTCLKKFSKIGYKLIVITNQSGVAHGYYTEKEVNIFHKYMNDDLFKSHRFMIDKFYFSPYHPDGILDKYRKKSNCRKPGNILFKKAIEDFNIIGSESIAIGDKYSDIEPAFNCGVEQAYLFDNNSTIDKSTNVKVVKNWEEIMSNFETLGLIS